MSHTPTPWTYDRFNGRIFRSTLDAPIANCATEANGNHIVHCVNTHAALVEALRAYKAVLDTKEFKEAMDSRKNMQLFDAYCKAENALALAEKGAS